MLYLQDVTIKRGSKVVFYNWNAKIENSKVTIICGKNGVGKSTLLRTIAGMIPLEKGIVKHISFYDLECLHCRGLFEDHHH